VAVADDARLLAEMYLDPRQRSAASLAPTVKRILQNVGWQPRDVELVAVTIGPGSFTGLRVGVTMAKVFAYAVGAEVLGVDTLETIAAGMPGSVAAAAIAVDAQRGEVMAQRFVRNEAGWLEPAGPQELLPIDAWLGGLAPGTFVAGPILEKPAGRLPPGVVAADDCYWRARAAEVAKLAARLHAAGSRGDVWSLLPRYSRLSAAEEKRRNRETAKR
jgi:tRNA threonylcarbamoyladenosine biosynthesis protein TsaB